MDSGIAQQIDWPEQRRLDDMTSKHDAGGKVAHVAGGWKASLAAVLKEHNGAKHDGAVASFATQDKRADVLYAGFRRLRDLNFRMETVMRRESQRGAITRFSTILSGSACLLTESRTPIQISFVLTEMQTSFQGSNFLAKSRALVRESYRLQCLETSPRRLSNW